MKNGGLSLLNYQKHQVKSSLYSGFTIVEMMVVAPIVILVIGIFITAIVNMTGDTLATRSSNALSYNIQNALNRIEQDVKVSGSFLATNNISITSRQGYDNATENFHNVSAANGTMLILNSYATDINPLNTSYKIVSVDNQPIMINIIYFVKNGTLWRRVITPANYTTANGTAPWQQPSCAIGITGTQCKTQDTRLVDGLVNSSDFSILYYPNSTSTTANAVAGDSSQSDTIRQTALLSSSTITANIGATSSIAGRNITRSGTIRAISPSNNISTTLPAQAPVVLTHPSNKTVLASDTNVTFNTSASGSSVSIKWQQSINKGTTWTDISGATSGTLTLATVSTTMDGYMYRAIFTNPQGSVTSSTALLTVNLLQWSTFALQNSWVDFGSTYNTSAYRKTTDGVVILKGLIKRTGTPVSGELIGTLPETYRPSNRTMFTTNTSGGVRVRIDILTNGEILYYNGSESWISLEGIHFLPDNGRYTRITAGGFANGWDNYNTPSWGLSSYAVDNTGRVHVQGLLKPGILTSGSIIFSMPAALAPSESLHIPAASVTWGHYNINASSQIIAKGSGSTYLSAQVMYYPASYNKWTTLTLQNSWVFYGGIYATPQYTKSPDGLVSLKGLIKSGVVTAGTVIAQLPVGYRPLARVLFGTVSNEVDSRVDIDTNGNIMILTGSNVWLSLDDITFYADQ